MIKFNDLLDAMYFVSSSSPGMNSAFLNLDTGEIFYRSEMGGIDEVADEDLEGDEWLSIPHKNDLDLGSQLVFQFVEEHLPDQYDQVRRFFKNAGAYGNTKLCWN